MTQVLGAQAAEVLDTIGPGCSCESCSVSPFGAVAPPELLLRLVVTPVHLNNKGTVKAAVMSGAEKSGLSILRARHATDDELRLAAKQIVSGIRKKNPNGGIHGVLSFTGEIVKSVNDGAGADPAYCIYDTAMVDKPAHADLFQRTAGNADTLIQTRRQNLYEAVKDHFTPVASFRGGLLMPWAAT